MTFYFTTFNSQFYFFLILFSSLNCEKKEREFWAMNSECKLRIVRCKLLFLKKCFTIPSLRLEFTSHNYFFVVVRLFFSFGHEIISTFWLFFSVLRVYILQFSVYILHFWGYIMQVYILQFCLYFTILSLNLTVKIKSNKMWLEDLTLINTNVNMHDHIPRV